MGLNFTSNILVSLFSDVSYEKTTDYHWPQIHDRDLTTVIKTDGTMSEPQTPDGPWGFGVATGLKKDEVR